VAECSWLAGRNNPLVVFVFVWIVSKIVIFDGAGYDKESGAGIVNDFKFISRSSPSSAMGSYKCNWAVVHGFGARLAG